MNPIILLHQNKIRLLLYVSMLLAGFSFSARAQPPPPRPIAIYVNPAQGLIFGAFFQGASGGTVAIFPDGSRSVTGSLILANLGYPYSPAIFSVEANLGTAISIMNGPDVTLTGSNGGTINLHIGTASTGSSFVTSVTPPSQTQVRIGGILTVGNALANPSGNYSGTFSVTFIQQ
ncbi:MAG: DUF4402 domain-containing protein [Bacteroidota bacterium]